MGYTTAVNPAEPLDGRPETIIGNSIDNLAPAPVFPGYGSETKLLYLPDPNSQRGQAMTLYIESRPIFVNGEYRLGGGPIVGILRIGSGGGGAEFEFDIQTPKQLTISPTAGSTIGAGPVSYRYGITIVQFRAGFFQLLVRNDGRMRTANIPGGVGDPLGTPDPPPIPPPPEHLGPQKVNLSAWVAYGFKENAPKIIRSIWVSNGSESRLLVDTFVNIPIPSGAKRVRFPRASDAPLSSPPLQIQQVLLNGSPIAPQVVPTGDNNFLVELNSNAQALTITNIGATDITRLIAKFELGL